MKYSLEYNHVNLNTFKMKNQMREVQQCIYLYIFLGQKERGVDKKVSLNAVWQKGSAQIREIKGCILE